MLHDKEVTVVFAVDRQKNATYQVSHYLVYSALLHTHLGVFLMLSVFLLSEFSKLDKFAVKGISGQLRAKCNHYSEHL